MHFLRRLSLPGTPSSKTSKSPRIDVITTTTTTTTTSSSRVHPSPPASPTTPTMTFPYSPNTDSRCSSPVDGRASPEVGKIKRSDNPLRRLSVILRRASTRRPRSVSNADPSSLAAEVAAATTSDASHGYKCPTLGTTSEEPEEDTQPLENCALTDSQWVKSIISIHSMVDEPHAFENSYMVMEPLGSGNFSTVYRVIRICDGVTFASKKINKSALSGRESLIRAEIDIHSALIHPNVIQVVEVFETADEWNIVLQIAPGGELFQYLVDNGAQGETRGRELAKSITKAMAFLHEKGVVHRDLKPENILLHSEDSTDVFIADFGLSTVVTPNEVLTKQCGSLEYAAPELLSGKGYNTKADMWSLGVVVFTVVAGYQPFQSRDDTRLLRTIIEGKYAFHDSHWLEISEDAKDFIRKLLQVDPKKRMSAQEALEHPWLNC